MRPRVIRRTLDALFTGFGPDELDVVVVCNGCTDDTAWRARACGHSVRVIELPAASKPAALRSGDAAARVFPRLYLDADVLMPGSAARVVLERLRTGVLAARPPIRYEIDGASSLVRSYYRARSRVPAVLGSLWGAGVYGLSESGRGRFGAFPDVVADDLWVDRLFAAGGGGDRGQCAGGGHGPAPQPRSVAGARSYLPGKEGARARTRSSRSRPRDRRLDAPRPRRRRPDRPRGGARRSDLRCLQRGSPARPGASPDVRTLASRRAVGAGRELEGGLR